MLSIAFTKGPRGELMMLKNTTKLAGIALVMGAVACGGSDPDIEQIKADFNSPSGSVNDQTGVIAANGKREASGGVLGLTGASGQALTATGKVQGLAQLNPQRLLDQRFRRIYYLAEGRKLSALSVDGDDFGCDNSAAAMAAQQDLENDLARSLIFSGGRKISANASYSVDLSECAADLSGNVKFTLKVEITQSKVQMQVKQVLSNVCESSGANACVDGTLLADATAEGGQAELSSLQFVTGWNLDASWDDEGVRQTAKTEGGVRLAATDDEFSIEYLVYCADSSGNRVSYILRIAGSEMDGLRLEMEGTDGKLSCTVKTTGEGVCMGTDASGNSFEVNWTDADFDNVVRSPEFIDI